MVFGIVVESQRDVAVYSVLIQRIRPDVELVVPRPCSGVVGVRQKFVGWLKEFEWHLGHQVDKALVIRDSDCNDPDLLEGELARILEQSHFQPTFPVHFYATRCMVEAWLLADEQAAIRVAQQRAKAPTVQLVPDPIEGIKNPKLLFQRMLSQARLTDTPAVYGEVASVVDTDRVSQRCPYFRQFLQCIHAC